uniref:Very early blastula protein 4 n=1 Tax=Strongylocentrotus purpuratus TaxID=7668 RepID=Q26662_STRPU|nr:very early blastula protein 4 [Strongylocentrotus purpuratus]AAA99910.1 very early blastula protein 4 [Strongylocentrotus purpuratus]
MADGARRFLQFSATELKKFLRDRRVPFNDEKHAELAEKAYLAEKLDLQVKPYDEKAEKLNNLVSAGKVDTWWCLIRLPRPETLTNGWEDSPANLPAISRDHIDSFIKAGNRRIGRVKTEGRRTLAFGKGLYMSGHVQSVQYHGINPKICYCFVRGKVVSQVKTSEPAYLTWLVLQKDTGRICTAECNCCSGVQATCKHIAALLFTVAEVVAVEGRPSCTSQPKAWGLPPKRRMKEALHQPQFTEDNEVVGMTEDVMHHELGNGRLNRSNFDPRLHCHRAKRNINDFDLDWLAPSQTGTVVCWRTPSGSPMNYDQRRTFQRSTDMKRWSLAISLTMSEALQDRSDIQLMEISTHQQQVIIIETKQQAKSKRWKKHTVTWSHICLVFLGTVCEAGQAAVRNGTIHDLSQVARVMGYFGSA